MNISILQKAEKTPPTSFALKIKFEDFIKLFGYIIVMGQENHSEEWRFYGADDFNENVADYGSDDIAVRQLRQQQTIVPNSTLMNIIIFVVIIITVIVKKTSGSVCQ